MYNPYRSHLSYRREQIIRELQHSHILGVVGTRTDASRVGQAVVQKTVAGHTWIEWGHGKGSHEQAAGVALAFRSKVFRDSNVRQVFEPPKEYAGRFGAVRLVRGDVDFCPIVVYQYPEPHPPRAERQRQRANRLWQYISGFIDKLPHRCVPVLILDANGHTGLMRVQGATAAIDSSAVGNSGGELENFNGHALRALLEQQHMCAVNTFGRPGFDCGSTFYGTNQRGTRVDYICLPQSLLCDVSRVRVHTDKAKKLQWHVCPGLRDHVPMSMEFKHALSYDSHTKLAFNRFDRDRLANAALTGAGRHEFLKTVDAKCAQALQQLGTSHPRPAVVWRHLQQTMHEATSQHFSASSSRRDRERPADTTAALQFTAHARKAVVELPTTPAPRDSLQFLSNLMQQWRRMAHFWRTRRASDQLLKRDYKQWELRRVEEFNHYWSKRDTRGCHRVSRLLSGFRMGPKMRRYDRPRSVQPTCDDWQLLLEQPGPQGGCLATPCSWDAVVRHACDPKPMQTTILAAHEEATHDLRGLRWVSKKLPLRRGCPTWSVPSEVWRQVLHPTWKIATRHFGVGFAQTQQLSISHFDRLLFRLLVSIRAYDETPVQWQRSQVATLDKHNGKPKCAGVRAINSLDVLGKVFYRWIGSKCRYMHPRPYASAYVKGKSRIDPMLQQEVVGWRARKAGLSVLTSSHDVANAFYSPKRQILSQCVDGVAGPEDRSLLQQRHQSTYMCISASDGVLEVCPGSGILQGDGFACVHFLEAYHPVLDGWQASLHNAVGEEFVSKDPVSGQEAHIAITSYADDVCQKHVVQDSTDMSFRAALSSALLEQSLETIDMAQNEDKQVHHVLFRGTGADENMRAAYGGKLVPGKIARCFKYLGGLSQYSGRNAAEIGARLRAANSAWCCFRRFWSRPKIPTRPLRNVFSCNVYSKLLSGLEARVLLDGECRRLDRAVLGYGRKLMRGEACAKVVAEDGTTLYHAVPSIDVWRFLQLAPTSIELRVRRLRFWQSVARNPGLHVALLAAVFGQCEFETLPTVDLHGRVSRNANPWALQFKSDVESLAECDDGKDLVEQLAGRVVRVFSDFREAFARVDCSVLRRQFLSVAIPPPGFEYPAPDLLDAVETERPHKCDCLLDNGSLCEAAFDSWQKLLVHKTFTKSGNHGKPSVARQAAVTNVCPWCRHVYASQRTAQSHIRRALQKRRCTGRGSNTVFAAEVPELVCPFCLQDHDSLDSLLTCITTHVAGPSP